MSDAESSGALSDAALNGGGNWPPLSESADPVSEARVRAAFIWGSRPVQAKDSAEDEARAAFRAHKAEAEDREAFDAFAAHSRAIGQPDASAALKGAEGWDRAFRTDIKNAGYALAKQYESAPPRPKVKPDRDIDKMRPGEAVYEQGRRNFRDARIKAENDAAWKASARERAAFKARYGNLSDPLAAAANMDHELANNNPWGVLPKIAEGYMSQMAQEAQNRQIDANAAEIDAYIKNDPVLSKRKDAADMMVRAVERGQIKLGKTLDETLSNLSAYLLKRDKAGDDQMADTVNYVREAAGLPEAKAPARRRSHADDANIDDHRAAARAAWRAHGG
jgi:hypothetical protein